MCCYFNEGERGEKREREMEVTGITVCVCVCVSNEEGLERRRRRKRGVYVCIYTNVCVPANVFQRAPCGVPRPRKKEGERGGGTWVKFETPLFFLSLSIPLCRAVYPNFSSLNLDSYTHRKFKKRERDGCVCCRLRCTRTSNERGRTKRVADVYVTN